MQKWVIQITEQQRVTLSTETLQLGDLIRNDKGETYLIFRDSFVALKVATLLGVKRSRAQTLPAGQVLNLEPFAHLSDGQVLVAA
jgi:hypothetical protein